MKRFVLGLDFRMPNRKDNPVETSRTILIYNAKPVPNSVIYV
ncbi:MAG: hypothetical protein P8X91_10145 [Candidatus Bathyarchaeota archaeon]